VSNLLQRLLIFFLGVPTVLAVVFFLPQYNHGAAILFVLVFTGGCALELARLFRAKGIAASDPAFLAFGALLPFGAYLGGLLSPSAILAGSSLGFLAAAGTLLVLSFSRFAFAREASIPQIIPQASALAFAIAYPGLLGSFVVLIASEPRFATESLLSFCLLTFMGDSAAWLFGMTLGRHRGVFAVSPNKSVEGFAGALFASVVMSFACSYIFPAAISADWPRLLALGLATGVATIVGDLFESAIKRSAGTKDSGTAVPGRGGFLDSFDSLLFAAPVFYGLSLLFGFFR
jgi:phosphatidate cytidylyltransferase